MATRYSAVRNPASSLWSRFQDSMTRSIPSILLSTRYTHQPTWLFIVWIWQFNIHNLRVGTLDSLFAPSDDLLNVIFRIRLDIWVRFCAVACVHWSIVSQVRRQIEELRGLPGWLLVHWWLMLFLLFRTCLQCLGNCIWIVDQRI